MSTWLGAIASSSFYTVAFNVVLTIPFGVYLRKYFHQKLHGVIFWGFLLSLFYEATQFTGVWGIYPHAFRFADVDDLVVNTAGAVLGYFAGGLLDKLLPDPAKDKILHVEHAGLPRRLLALFMDSIIVNVLFEILRVTVLLLTGSKQNLIDMALYAVSSSAVFVLLPFVSKKKQTLGMSMLKLSFEDKNGELPRISGMLLHSVWIGLWLNLVPGLMGMVQSNGIIMVLQMFMLVPLIVIIFASVKNKRITYFWENCFDIYIKVDVLRK